MLVEYDVLTFYGLSNLGHWKVIRLAGIQTYEMVLTSPLLSSPLST